MQLLNQLAIGAKIDKVGDGSNSLVDNITTIITVVIAMLGILAVIVIVIGGIGYMTSSGDTQKVKKAKDTILYGIIGLIIAALAFVIVQFVISSILGQS